MCYSYEDVLDLIEILYINNYNQNKISKEQEKEAKRGNKH
jgi:hypothetical protein